MRFRFPDKPTSSTPTFIGTLARRRKLINQWKYDGHNTEVFYNRGRQLLVMTSGGLVMKHPKFTDDFRSALQLIDVPEETVLNVEFVGPRHGFEPHLYIFDVYGWDGEWLVDEGYGQRWARCNALNLSRAGSLVSLAHTIEGDPIAEFERLRAGWKLDPDNWITEGIVAKDVLVGLRLASRDNATNPGQYKTKFRDVQREINR